MEKSSQQTAGQPKPQPESPNRAQDLMREGRTFCFFVSIDCYDKERGFRPSIVFENEPGHYPNGGGDVEPWWWGHDYKGAQEICRKKNLEMGVDEDEVNHIVASSMFQSRKGA